MDYRLLEQSIMKQQRFETGSILESSSTNRLLATKGYLLALNDLTNLILYGGAKQYEIWNILECSRKSHRWVIKKISTYSTSQNWKNVCNILESNEVATVIFNWKTGQLLII